MAKRELLPRFRRKDDSQRVVMNSMLSTGQRTTTGGSGEMRSATMNNAQDTGTLQMMRETKDD